jgi:hypothetical protein
LLLDAVDEMAIASADGKPFDASICLANLARQLRGWVGAAHIILGWLNQVGISATTGAKIYAFYHPTFQEYFAAQAVTNWQYFFRSNPTTHPPIFNPSWQETILFWFGRELSG